MKKWAFSLGLLGFLLIGMMGIGITSLRSDSTHGFQLGDVLGLWNDPRDASIAELFVDHTWGDLGDEEGWSVWRSGDYLYAVGTTESYGTGKTDLALVKWNQDGTVMWYRAWGGLQDDAGTGIWGDGTYLYTCGWTESYGSGGKDFVVVKWDTAGAQVWARYWGEAGNDHAAGIWGNSTAIFACGTMDSFGAGGDDLAVVVWDSGSGTRRWNQSWGGVQDDVGSAVWSNGSAIYTVGTTASTGAGGNDLAFVVWDETSNLAWTDTWGWTGDDRGTSVQGNTTAVFACGTTDSFGAGGKDITIATWNQSTGFAWNTTWGDTGNDEGSALQVAGEQLFIVGNTTSYGAGGVDACIVQYYTDGEYGWNRTWGGTADDFGLGVWSDGTDHYACGSTRSFGNGGSDMNILKWSASWIPDAPTLKKITPDPDEDGNISLNWTAVEGATSYRVYREESNISKVTTNTNRIGSTNKLEYIDENLKDDKYYYMVTAVNASGESNASNCVSVVVDKPGDDSDGTDGNGNDGTYGNIPGFPLLPLVGTLAAVIWFLHRKIQR